MMKYLNYLWMGCMGLLLFACQKDDASVTGGKTGFLVRLAEGVDDKVKTAVQAVRTLGQEVVTAVQKSLNMSWNVGGLVPSAGTSVVNNYYNNDNSRTVNQTNNSPKALSRLEIYRLTRNALKV